jgi:hypothetical protein
LYSFLDDKVPRHVVHIDDTITPRFDDALEIMARLGATVVDGVEFSEWKTGYTSEERFGWRLAFRITLRESKLLVMQNEGGCMKLIY